MASLMTVTVDTRQVKRALADLKGKAPVALMRAVNRTAASANTQAKKLLAADMGITQKAVQKELKVVKANKNFLTASLVATGVRIPLIFFKARQTATGVSYNIGQGRKRIPHAFITTVRSRRQAELGYAGHEGVFTRLGKGRLPLSKEKRGPSIPHVFTAKAIMTAMLASAKANLAKNLDHAIHDLLTRKGGTNA